MSKKYQVFISVSFSLAITALVLQLYFAIVYWTNEGLTFIDSVGQYFSYYTILTNLMAAVTLFMSLKTTAANSFFSRKYILFGININLVFVGIAYNVLLRDLWSPVGMQFIVNEILHSVMPVLYLIFYFLIRDRSPVKWVHVFKWQIYPVVYTMIIMLRGGITGLYPYPFLNPGVFSFSIVISYIVILLLSVFILMSVFLFIDRFLDKRMLSEKA